MGAAGYERLHPSPPGPPGPGWAHGLAMLFWERRLFEWCRRRYGDTFALRIELPFEQLVVIGDPEEAKRVFTTDATVAHAGEANATLAPLLGDRSVLLLDEAPHLENRKLLLPAFHGERVRAYEQIVREEATAELERWPVGEPFALLPSMQKLTLRIILRAVFGIERGDSVSELEGALERLLLLGNRTLVFPWLHRNLGRRSPWGRFLAARSVADEMIAGLIARRREADDLEDRADVLSGLLRARDDTGSPMSDAHLRDALMTLLIAGHETSASQLAWTFERVLRHPAVLERLREDLESGSRTYCDSVIKEAQRTRPVLTMALRKLTSDTVIGGHHVRAGSTVATSATLIHSRPDLYTDPARFEPERFERGEGGTYSWIAFGGGVRRCLGAAFATTEMRVVLETVLERCLFELPHSRAEPPRRRMITFVPRHGARVRQARPPRAKAAA